MKYALFTWLLYQLPEAFLMLYCGTRLLGLRPVSHRFWSAVLVFAISIPLARLLPLPFGFHTLLLFFVYVATSALFFRVSIQTALTAATIVNFLLSMGYALVLAPVLAVKRLSVADMLTSLPRFLLMSYLEASILIIVSFLVRVFRFKLINAPEVLTEPPGTPGESE